MSQNICRGGDRDIYGRPEDRWSKMSAIIREIDPHILLLQEAWGFAKTLPGMRMLIAPSRTGCNIGAYREDTLRLAKPRWETHLGYLTAYGFGIAAFALPGMTAAPANVQDRIARPEGELRLAVTSVHLTPYSAAAAAQEAQLLLSRSYRHDAIGLLGGDINHLPADPEFDPDPDWSKVPEYNVGSRTNPSEPDEPIAGDRIVGRTLRQGQMTDVALHLAKKNNDRSLCAPTGHGGIRVDQFHVTPALVPAICGYRTVDPQGYSDHSGILTTIDTELVDTGKSFQAV